MEKIEDLQRKLSQYESELASLSRRITKDTPFMPGELDGHSESYSWTEYTDPKRAKYLEGEIARLRDIIKNYGRDAEEERRHQERREYESEIWREDRIVSVAKELYDARMAEYMEKNFWGKAKMLFAGKKPKKMKDPEIISTYGGEAVTKITSPAIERLILEKESQLEAVKKEYADDPKMLEYAIRQTNLYFDGQIKRIQETYGQSLSDVTEKRK